MSQINPQERIPGFLTPFAVIGNNGIYILTDLGRMGVFLFYSLRGILKVPFRFREFVKQLHFIGTGSIGVIFFTAISSGMVLGLQGFLSLKV